MSAKQDKSRARTVTDMQRRYNFGKTFAELVGLAQDAQDDAAAAKAELEKMDAEKVFQILTDGETDQGIYRIGGKIYLNMTYAKSGQLLADLIKAGILQSKDGETFYLDLENGVLKGKFQELLINGQSVGTIAQNAVKGQTQMDIFNKLTNNGKNKGIYYENGELYVNASYLMAGVIGVDRLDLKALFAKDITMTGKFTSTAMAKLPPTMEDVNAMYAALVGDTMPPSDGSYDLDGDGDLTVSDVQLAFDVVCGRTTMENCPGAMEKEAAICIDMSNSEKTIRIYGINQWGTLVESYIGADYHNSKFVSKDQLSAIVCHDGLDSPLYRKVFGSEEKEYFNPPMVANVEYRTIERWLNQPVYTKIVAAQQVSACPYSILRRSETVSGNVQLWYVK